MSFDTACTLCFGATIISLLTVFLISASCETATAFEIRHQAQATEAGVAIFTCEQAELGWTELNSQYEVRHSDSVTVETSAVRECGNTLLKNRFKGIAGAGDYLEIVMSVFGHLDDGRGLPLELSTTVRGVRFSAKADCKSPISLKVHALNARGQLLAAEHYLLKQQTLGDFEILLDCSSLKEIVFRIEGGHFQAVDAGTVVIDDVYLINDSDAPFVPPESDQEFIDWLRECSIRYFLWAYRESVSGKAVVLETSHTDTKVSLSGMGYGLAANILAQQQGMLSSQEAEERCLAMLRWLHGLDCFNGNQGWHGFPFHYFHLHSRPFGRTDVSTIDWAICAAGIRTTRQRFSDNEEIVLLADELLDRPDWSKSVGPEGKIAMGFDGDSGHMNDYRWGRAYSEETELVYLEALATEKLDPASLKLIVRDRKNGFYPSWFGSGFTYNWLQLWTGPTAPYCYNSQVAFQHDLEACQQTFDLPLIGLTACATIDKFRNDGFVRWRKYISNQGSDAHATSNTTEVIRISPAPYGAALALPFLQAHAIEALRAYADLGHVHPLLGLPDTIRLKDLPHGFHSVPNWQHFDINIGSIALAIEQIRQNTIAKLYTRDSRISAALRALVRSQ